MFPCGIITTISHLKQFIRSHNYRRRRNMHVHLNWSPDYADECPEINMEDFGSRCLDLKRHAVKNICGSFKTLKAPRWASQPQINSASWLKPGDIIKATAHTDNVANPGVTRRPLRNCLKLKEVTFWMILLWHGVRQAADSRGQGDTSWPARETTDGRSRTPGRQNEA